MPKGNGKPIPQVEVKKDFSKSEREELLKTLKSRFEKNKTRHKGISWDEVQKRLEKNEEKIKSLLAMESTGGEPDVIGHDKKTGKIIFCDCSLESPQGRRSICYDKVGEEMRKKKGINPGGNAVDLAEEMGIELLNEEQYRELQKLGDFDTKTSSWIKTPESIRKLGGAVFCDKRYEHVFLYHNGAESFYSSRGFRGFLRI